VEITAGNSLDVQEIDAASNRGIDSIRELRESVRYGTARDRFKIFIVDEVHMLTNEAFNALLKTLEEPPEHVKFILATTEYQKIPVTITSRCQQYEFRPIPFSLILERLKLITDSEKIEISDEALRSLVSAGQGSMRDAQSALDQMIAFSGKEVKDEDVRALLGIVDVELVSGLMEKIVEQDKEGLLTTMREVRKKGISPRNFCSTLVEYIRNLMITRVMGWDEDMVHLSDSLRETVEAQARVFSELDLIRFYDSLNRTNNELRWHSHPYNHLEINLLKLIELAKLPAIEEVLSRLQSDGLAVETKTSPTASVGAPAEDKTRFWNRLPSAEDGTPVISEPKTETAVERISVEDPVVQLMKTLQSRSMGLYQHLRMASEVNFGEGKLTIRFSKSEHFHARQVQEDENRRKLSDMAAAIKGHNIAVDVDLEGGGENEAVKEDPMKNPKVQTFLDRFPGKVIVNREPGD